MGFSVTNRINKIYKVLLILLIISLSFTGCVWNDTTDSNTSEGLESGFKYSSVGCDDSSIFHCGYKTDKTEFDLDHVTVDLYYGGEFYNDYGTLCVGFNIPSFDIFVAVWNEENRNYDKKYLLKHVEENFISEKYNCKVLYTKCLFGETAEIVFNHYETINIPKEAFSNENGAIAIMIFGTYTDKGYQKEENITGTIFYYKVVDGKVVLSSQINNK